MNITSQIATATAVWLLAAVGPPLRAQGSATPSYPSANSPSQRFSPPAGNFVVQPHLAEPVTSFDQLIRMSDLIVDGTVVSVLPAIIGNPDVPGHVETDSLISIRQVIQGKSTTPGQVLLVQTGGTQGKWNVSVAGDPLVQLGQRYILFLDRDQRTVVPNGAGILPDASVAARYFSVGNGNGKALVSATGTIQFALGATPTSHQYDGNEVTSFITTVTNRVNTLFPPTPPYPRGVKPVPPPPGGLFDPSHKSGSSAN